MRLLIDPSHRMADHFRNIRHYVDVYRKTDNQKTKKRRKTQTKKQKETNKQAITQIQFSNKQANKQTTKGIIQDNLCGGKCVDRIHSEPR